MLNKQNITPRANLWRHRRENTWNAKHTFKISRSCYKNDEMFYMDFLFCFQRLTRRWMWSPCPHFLSAGQRLESASWCHVQEWLGLVREDTGDVDPRQGPRCQGFPPSCTWSPPQAMMSSRAISCEELCFFVRLAACPPPSLVCRNGQPHQGITQTFQRSQLALKIACLCCLWTSPPSNIPNEPCQLYFRIMWR